MRITPRLLLPACLWLVLSPLHGQDMSYADEYQNRIKSASTVESLNETPFGESTDVYTGATSFEQTDLVLEGKGPAIRLTRRSTESDYSTVSPLQFSGFGDWELEVPQIQTLVPGTLKWGSTVGVWETAGGSGRCTNFGEMWTPPDGYYGPRSITAPAESWWSGYTLKIPGMGSQTILSRLPPAPGPSSGTYPGVTTQHWQVGCQTGLGTSNGQPGEGFVVLAPDGTKYFMTHLSYSPYATYREAFPEDYRLFAHVGRTIARMKASRVEDRFGNYITYNYTGDNLTSITGSDGRSVTIQWWSDAPLIQSITANGRTWTYNYASRSATGGTLSQVVMPDARSWTFSGTAQLGGNGPVYLTGCLFSGAGPTPGSSTGIDRTYVLGHPSGLSGTFRYSNRLRARSYAGSMCETDYNGQTSHETSNPYFLVNSLIERELSGPGMANALWTYTYEVEHASTYFGCPSNTCPSTTYTDVLNPNGDRTRYIHSTRDGAIQGKLLRVENYSGAQLVRSEDKTYNYVATDVPYIATFGYSLNYADPAYGTENLVLLRKNVITQQGRTFTWEVPTCSGGLTGYCFDDYGRPTKTAKSSSP